MAGLAEEVPAAAAAGAESAAAGEVAAAAAGWAVADWVADSAGAAAAVGAHQSQSTGPVVDNLLLSRNSKRL